METLPIFSRLHLQIFSITLPGLFQRAFMTGIVSPYSDAPRKHYPGGGPATTFAIELAKYAGCPAGNGFMDEGKMISCLREVTAEKLINASISLYEEKYKNQVNMLLAVLLKRFSMRFTKPLAFGFRFTPTVNVTIFRTIQKWVRCSPLVLFTHNIKKDQRCFSPKQWHWVYSMWKRTFRDLTRFRSPFHVVPKFCKLIYNWFYGKRKKMVNWSNSKTVS